MDQKTNGNICFQIVFFKKPKFEDYMLKNDKYNSKDKSVQFFFLFYLNKIHHFRRPKHDSISALPGLDRKIILHLSIISGETLHRSARPFSIFLKIGIMRVFSKNRQPYFI
jgi:hypothetical protein